MLAARDWFQRRELRADENPVRCFPWLSGSGSPEFRISLLLARSGFVVAAISSAFGKSNAVAENTIRDHRNDGIMRFIHEMPATIRANHPAILPVAAAIRAVSTDPLEQIVMVNDVTHLLVDYDDDQRVYGRAEFHATLDEMIARRREARWTYLRDDCDGRAVFAAHLLASLGIPWRLAASYWKQHAWVIARVAGVDYDLLDFREHAPETNRIAYRIFGHAFVRAERRPPYFAWRRTWRERTNANVEIGKRLGALELDSTPAHLTERVATDWTTRHPAGQTSPEDPRAAEIAFAGFPLGERLHPIANGGISTAVENSEAPRLVLNGASAAVGYR